MDYFILYVFLGFFRSPGKPLEVELPSTNAILKLFARLHVCVCWSHLVHEHWATSWCLFVSFSKYCHDSNWQWEVFSLFASFAFVSGLFFFADRGVSLVHACNSLVLMFSGANASEKPPCSAQTLPRNVQLCIFQLSHASTLGVGRRSQWDRVVCCNLGSFWD